MTAVKVNPEDLAKRITYIEEMLKELGELATEGELEFLAHLLEMARLEALSMLTAGISPKP